MSKDLVIVGIDPGTTTGYAILDLDGKVIDKGSSRHIELSGVIEKVINSGIPVVTGTDVSSVPSFVSDFSIKNGTRLINPKEDLSKEEKKNLVSSNEFENWHEMDALAAAKYAYKSVKHLISRVNRLVKDKEVTDLKYEVMKIVLSEELSPISAIELLSGEDNNIDESIKETVIDDESVDEEDFKEIYDKYHKANNSIKLLENQNKKLKNKLKKIREENRKLESKIKKIREENRKEEILKEKEKRIKAFDRQKKQKESIIESLNEKIKRLQSLLNKSNDKIILKKIENLGSSLEEDKVFTIDENDYIFVENPNSFSENKIKELNEKITLICEEKPNNKIQSLFSGRIIHSPDIIINETENFGIASEEEIKEELNNEKILREIITEYRND